MIHIELLESLIVDIRKMIDENPNDADLGKRLRSYFIKLQEVMKEIKKDVTGVDDDITG